MLSFKRERSFIIGPSGTGKSTLLRCINRLEPPTSGSILVDGEDITLKSCDLPKLRQKMGMVFQNFNLFSHKTVLENVSMPVHDLLKKTGIQQGKKLWNCFMRPEIMLFE